MKRKLTYTEIEDILHAIKPQSSFPNEIGLQICENVQSMCRKQLLGVQIYPECILQLSTEIVAYYNKCQVQAGLNVGILSAQSAGERQTQLVLNSFHSAGQAISTVISGVPRFAELLNATKKPKNVITNVYFKTNPADIKELRKMIGSDIVGLKLSDLVERHEAIECSCDFWSEGKRVRRFHLRMDLLYKYKLTLKAIADRLPSVVYRSPDIYGILDIADLYEDDCIATHLAIHLFGIPEISNVIYKKDTDGIWCIEALGYNLAHILTIPNIDATKTVSNHMWEIFLILGTEAVREFLITEFTSVISTDAYINNRNINLLVDMMMYTGNISSISRYGVHRNQSGVLTKSSFEESLDQFITSGLYGDSDTTIGISSSIICGKQSKAGTGLCDLVYRV